MAFVAVIQGIVGLRRRNSRPLVVAEGELAFWRGSKRVVVETGEITRIWYNTKGLDKRVSIALQSGEVIDIPPVYGLAGLAKKLSRHLQLT